SSLATLSAHSVALLVYLILLALAGVIAATRAGSWIRLAFWLAVAAPLLLWSTSHGSSTWLLPGLTAWAVVFVLSLAGLLNAPAAPGAPFGAADIILLHLNGLAVFGGSYLLIEPVRSVVNAPLAAGFAVLAAGVSYGIRARQREEALHFLAL